MAVAARILIEKAKGMALANQLYEAAAECGENIAVIDRQIGELRESLQGEAGDALLAKFENWRRENIAIKEGLESAAGRLRASITALVEADESLAEHNR